MVLCRSVTCSEVLPPSRARSIFGFLVAGSVSLLVAACGPAALTLQMEAQGLATDLQVQFTKAADAGNRAVMADTDDAASVAAREAEQATQAAERTVQRLQPILSSLRYSDALRFLDTFNSRFAEFRALDAEILPLAIENTNLKAQRLSFGPARQAVDDFRASLEVAAKLARSTDRCCVDALVARAEAALLEIQVAQAPHIAEADDAAMTRMEAQMATSEATARKALARLKALVSPAGAQLSAASTALDRFIAINNELVTLSRRNSNVRSLALSLGRKRTVTAQCDDQLQALQEALAKLAVVGTR